MVLSAKTKSELEKAKKKYEKWKNEIGKSRKIKFGWKYNKKVDNLKSDIDENIGPEDAILELKNMIDHASHSDGFRNDYEIKNWMNKYPLNAFHEVYKKEVRDLTDKAFSLIKQPEEEVQSDNTQSLVALIPGFLFMSPTQAHAVNDLKNIMDKNSNNYTGILEWIYIYRNVPFSEPYRQAISILMPTEYGLNLNKRYSIPNFYDNGKLKNKEIKNLIKETVINYFGILLCGNDLSEAKKIFIEDAYKQSKITEPLSEIIKNDEDVDKILKAQDKSAVTITYSGEKDVTEITIDETADNEATPEHIQQEEIDLEQKSSILPEEAFKPQNVKKDVSPEIQVEISSILPDIEFEEQITSSSIVFEKTTNETFIEEMMKELEEKDFETSPSEPSSSFELTASYEELEDSSFEIPLVIPEKSFKESTTTIESNISTENDHNSQPYNSNKTNEITESSVESTSVEAISVNTDENITSVTYSEVSTDNSETVDPYQLTEDDIDNIENIFLFVNSRMLSSRSPNGTSIQSNIVSEIDSQAYQRYTD